MWFSKVGNAQAAKQVYGFVAEKVVDVVYLRACGRILCLPKKSMLSETILNAEKFGDLSIATAQESLLQASKERSKGTVKGLTSRILK